MIKKLATKESATTTKYSIEDTRNLAIASSMSRFNNTDPLKELAGNQLPKLKCGEVVPDEILQKFDAISRTFSLESGFALLEGIRPEYRGFALQLREGLKKEFDCKTPSEITLVDQVVNSHIRKISNSKLLEHRNEPEWLSHEKVALLNFYSREIDRAHRQFISAIEALKFIKQPAIKVNINATTAFVGDKQQFNTNQVKKDENNEPK